MGGCPRTIAWRASPTFPLTSVAAVFRSAFPTRRQPARDVAMAKRLTTTPLNAARAVRSRRLAHVALILAIQTLASTDHASHRRSLPETFSAIAIPIGREIFVTSAFATMIFAKMAASLTGMARDVDAAVRQASLGLIAKTQSVTASLATILEHQQ